MGMSIQENHMSRIYLRSILIIYEKSFVQKMLYGISGIAISKKLVPKSGKIGKKWKHSEIFVFALSMKSNVSGTQRKKNWSLISSQKKVMLFLVNSLYICIGTGFWGKFYIYTRKILFVSHQRASWPDHMTQFLSRSVVTHHTTHIAICIWHDHDF